MDQTVSVVNIILAGMMQLCTPSTHTCVTVIPQQTSDTRFPQTSSTANNSNYIPSTNSLQ